MRYPIIDLGAFPIYKFMGGLGFILGLLLLINNLKTYKIREKKRIYYYFCWQFPAWSVWPQPMLGIGWLCRNYYRKTSLTESARLVFLIILDSLDF